MILNVLRTVTCFFIVATLLPFLKWDYWWIRVFDYPRIQKLIIILLLMLFWVLLRHSISKLESTCFILLLASASIFLFFKVIPFSPFGEKMIETVEFDPESSIHILVGNVYQENTAHQKVLTLVQDTNPDIVFLVETDSKWENGLKQLEELYPHQLKLPMDNTYGLLLYSKLALLKHEVHHLIDEEIPSIELEVELKNGSRIRIYGIHPTPPVPTHNPTSTDRDAEILIVGKKVKNSNMPSLVIGDLNDVAWSYSTELFLKISEMADPRRGRGAFNTFHAKIPFLRWPLDHVFLSKHFGLVSMKVHDSIGSDHFPISIIARLTPNDDTDTKKANGEEKKEAREKIDRGLKDED